jgi:D-serine dehydratase
MLDLDDPLLDPSYKGYPPHASALRRSQIGAQGWCIPAGDLTLPIAVLRHSALQHNLRWMQDFADARSLALAPHGKTTLSPQLFQAQIAAGAWGLSVATVQQLHVAVHGANVQRVIIANQLVQAADLRAVRALRRTRPHVQVLFLLDSHAQLDAIEAATMTGDAPFEVLLELGVLGARCGLREHAAALVLARRARGSAAVRLVGVECYEGLGVRDDDAADRAYVAALMQRVQALVLAADREQLFETETLLLSAGGSAVFDLVVPGLRAPEHGPGLSRPVLGVLRSGCYVTHDHGIYQRHIELLERRLASGPSLRAALEVWCLVQSLPEPGLALLNVGKRDVGYDTELPVALSVWPAGVQTPRAAPQHWQIQQLNDQHAYLRLAADGDALQVGDRVVLGISHPCTTFDKWRWLPVVDDAYAVIDAVVTWF